MRRRTGHLHTVLDDHSGVAYTETGDDETAATAVATLRRAVARFTARGIVIQAVLSGNGSCHRSRLRCDATVTLDHGFAGADRRFGRYGAQLRASPWPEPVGQEPHPAPQSFP